MFSMGVGSHSSFLRVSYRIFIRVPTAFVNLFEETELILIAV